MGRIRNWLAAVFLASLIIFSAAGAPHAETAPGRPLALDECIDIALGGHPRVKAAEQDMKAGEYRTEQAESAYWPWLNFEASRNYIHSERQARVGAASVTTTANYIANNFTLNANWTLFDFGRTYYSVKGLSELEGALTRDLTASEQSLALDVVNSYFTLLQSQRLVGVAKETMAASQSHLDQANAFYDVGVKPRFDVTNAEVELNGAKLSLIEAEHGVKLARLNLNSLLGYAPAAQTEVVDMPPTEKLTGTMEEYVGKAMEQRPELQSLEFTARSAEMNVRGAYADYLPTVSAGASQNWYKEDHTDILSNQNLVMTLNVPIFEGFKTRSALGAARAGALSARYRLEDTRRGVEVEVGTAYLGVEDAAARIQTLDSSVKKARENLEIAQGRYEAGVGPLIEVTDAQLGLTNALTDKAKADYDYHIAYARLLKSIGKTVKGQGQGQ